MNSVNEIKKICVLGGGLMGSQIALQAATKGYETWMYDSFPEVVDKVEAWVKKYLAGRVEKGKMTQEETEKAMSLLHLSKELEPAATGADLVIEAIIEKKEEKEALFKKVDKLVAADAIIATNSSFMVSSLFKDCVSNPDRLANLHYFNPAMAMKLVEIVRGDHTADGTVKILYDFVKSIGKIPVIINKEIDGFIVNRISRAISLAALELVELNVATPEDIDLALENGLNHPMGPFRLMDLTGIDLSFFVLDEMEKRGEHKPGYQALKTKYENGELGRKTGKGWYDYSK